MNKIDEIKAYVELCEEEGYQYQHLDNLKILLQEIERLQVEFWRISAENQQQNNFRFMAEIERKDEALRFYADKDNYNHPYVPAVVEDAGNRAREAL